MHDRNFFFFFKTKNSIFSSRFFSALTEYLVQLWIWLQVTIFFAYRNNGAIVVFEILPDGSLDRVQVQYVGGPNPRHFKVHPSGEFLLVALQDAGKIEMYTIDSATGLISLKDSQDCPNKPTIIALLDL